MKNNRYNAITICPVRSLEVGDLIAKEFLRRVISGKITGIAYTRHDLNDEQRAYMQEKGLHIPDNDFDGLGGATSYLIFGEFNDRSNHMYVDFDVNVAVFHPQPAPPRESLEESTVEV